MMTTVDVLIRTAYPAPWAVTVNDAHPVAAAMIGRPRPLPDGAEVALVSFADQPHWVPGFRITVYGLAFRRAGEPWCALAPLRGERDGFGPLDAQTWRDRTVDGAWERARSAQ